MFGFFMSKRKDSSIDRFIADNLDTLENRRRSGSVSAANLLGVYQVSRSGTDPGGISDLLLGRAYQEYISEFGPGSGSGR